MKINEVLFESFQPVPMELLDIGQRVTWAVRGDMKFGTIVEIQGNILVCKDDKYGTDQLTEVPVSRVLRVMEPEPGSNMMRDVWEVGR